MERFIGGTIDDPVFGRLRLTRGEWEGTVGFRPQNAPVDVVVPAAESGPTDVHHNAYRDLEARYDGLIPRIAEELLRLYQPYQAEFDYRGAEKGAPGPRDSREMAELVTLEVVEIRDETLIRLYFAFREGAGWPDALFTLELRDWLPVGIALDD